MENNIYEGTQVVFGFTNEAATWGVGSSKNNQYLGNIVRSGAGAGLVTRDTNLNGMSRNALVKDNYFVCTSAVCGERGLGLLAPKAAVIRNNTFIGHGWGIHTSNDTGDGAPSFAATNNLILSSVVNAWLVNTGIYTGSSWSLDHTAVFGAGGSPATDANITAGVSLSSDPLGSCAVYIPSSATAIKGQGAGGADIGANILYQYVNGTLTSAPLWDFSQSGANRGQWIARGATVAGVNDVAGSSLFDVHQRLGFGTGLCASPGSPSPPLPPTFPGNALVGAWGFQEPSGNTANDSSNSSPLNNASLQNGATRAPGKFVSALSLDGVNQYGVVADANSLDFTQSFTFSAWVFPDALHSDWRAILVKNYMVGLYASSTYCGGGTPVIWFDSDAKASFYACYAQPLPIKQWTHLAGTYDGANLKLYVNGGASPITTPATGYITPSNLELDIGRDSGGQYFEGRIAEARVYNFAIPLTDGKLNTVPGAACGYTSQADRNDMAKVSILGDMNCPVIAGLPPLNIKIPASPTGLKTGAAAAGLKLGSKPE